MRVAISLRRRVILACTALAFVLSLLFAGSTYWMTESYEHILINVILQDEAADFSERLQRDPGLRLPRTPRLSGYLQRQDGNGDVPTDLLELAPGIHEMDGGTNAHIGVYDTPSGRLYFAIDMSGVEELEESVFWFLCGVVVLGTLAGAWIGRVLAGMTIQPVQRLAEAVNALAVKPSATRMRDLVANDELGRLARAIDEYQARLVDADAHERQFFADASHELRTPIAVMRGAAEVLLDDPRADPPTQRRLQRLDRGLVELTDLLEVMLGLARRRVYTSQSVDCLALLQTCVPATEDTPAKSLHIEIRGSGSVFAPPQEAALVMRGVLRRTLPPDARGELLLEASDAAITVSYRPQDSAPAPAAQTVRADGSDGGLGLTLVARLAQRLGWRIVDIEMSPRQRVVRVEFGVAGGA